MLQGLMQLGGLAGILVLTLGPVVALVELLNLRDRRQLTLLNTVCAQFSAQAVRSDIAVQVHCALFSRRSVVTVDMRACSPDEIWDAIMRLSQRLPPHVRLVVDGTVNRQLPATFTVEATVRPPLCSPSRPSVAIG